MLHCNNLNKSSNYNDLVLLKYHVGVAQIRLCDRPDSCSISGGRALKAEGIRSKLCPTMPPVESIGTYVKRKAGCIL
jgi:hypothetical protein